MLSRETGPYFDLTIPEFVFVMKNTFQWHIICLCLACFQKVTFFKINSKNCQLKFISFCLQNQLGLEIRIRDHSRTRFDAMN